MNIFQKLEERKNHVLPDTSKLRFISSCLFGFVTDDDDMDELFAQKAVETCYAISTNTTSEYINDPENYQWFLIMVNSSFFQDRLDYGISIRCPWWDITDFSFLNMTGLDSTDITTTDQWKDFCIKLKHWVHT